MISGYRHFGHEGIRRRAFYSPVEQEWKDVTCLAILATDWINRAYRRFAKNAAPLTLWDEMLARHQQEREKLLKWEENQRGGVGVKRTSSMETIRCLTDAATESDAESVVSEEPMTIKTEQDDPFSDSNSPGKGKRKLSSRKDDESLTDPEMSDADDASSPYTLNKPGPSNQNRYELLADDGPPSPTLSHYSTASSVPTTDSETSLSDESQWERLESKASLAEGWSSNDESDWEQEHRLDAEMRETNS